MNEINFKFYLLCRREALMIWHKKLGQKATYREVAAAFKRADRQDLADNVYTIIGMILLYNSA